MTKRHVTKSNDWESVFSRLEELMLANSGEDPFEEVFKLLVAKLWDELKNPIGVLFQCQKRTADTRDGINALLQGATEDWPGILSGSSTSALTDEHLAVCVESLSKHTLSEASFEAVDAFFERLVTNVSKGAKGQYFTPRHIVDFCVRLVNPAPGELVCDPACGSGGFLLHSLRHLSKTKPNIAKESKEFLWGFDFDHRAMRVAKALMLFAGSKQTSIYRLNSLLTPNSDLFVHAENSSDPFLTIEDVMRTRGSSFRGFDVILTNPPFAGELKEKHFLTSYSLHKSGRIIERDILFLERCVQLLRPGGRLAIVLPHNKLGSQSWSYAREWLLRQVRVTAVIGLGRNTFLPHTHQKTSVLIGVKRIKPIRHLESERIFFAISEREGKNSKGQFTFKKGADSRRSLWEKADHDLDDVLKAFQEFQTQDASQQDFYGSHSN